MDPRDTSSPTSVVEPEATAVEQQAVQSLPLFAGLVAVVLAFDQATKVLVRGWLAVGESWPEGDRLIQFTRVENAGAAFGILQGAGPFLIVTSLIAVFAILAFFVWAPPQSRFHVAALSLVLGGALGNLVDRVFRGTVTDFIDPTNYPSFNIADSAIVAGVSALIVVSIFEGDRERRDERGASSPAHGEDGVGSGEGAGRERAG